MKIRELCHLRQFGIACAMICVSIGFSLKESGHSAVASDKIAALSIGTDRQLFVDDYIVDEKQAVTREIGQVTKANDGRPIFTDGRLYGTVLHDEGRFKFWYRKPGTMGYGYAESSDGLHFERKADVSGIPFAGDFTLSVELDPHETDPQHRFIAGFDAPGMSAGIAHSADGIHWTPYNDGKPVTGRAADTYNQIFRDPIANTWRLLTRTDFGGPGGPGELRGTRSMTNSDPKNHPTDWKLVREWVFDREGPQESKRRQIYATTCWINQGVYFALLSVYDFPGDTSEGATTDLRKRHERDVMNFYIATSRDGDSWDLQWVYAGKPLIPRGPDGAFDKDIIIPASTIVTHNDLHWIYYMGANERHGNEQITFNREHAVGLATLKLDRFVGLTAGPQSGTVTTKPFVLTEPQLQVNVNAAEGELYLEVLDEEGRAIPGFALSDAVPAKAIDELRWGPEWTDRKDLSTLLGRTIRLKFHLRNAAVYSFQAIAAPPVDVRVMSFNIRYGTAKDGENHWDHRREFLVRTIQTFKPDLLGTQETLAFQRDFLADSLKDYEHLGAGRDDGREAGEMTALFYRRDRFEKLDGGHFWLSETPEIVASKSWDTSLTRMVTWVKLKDRQQKDAQPIVFFNTHFDHQGVAARLESARLLRRQLTKLASDCRIIITGDFNTGEKSAPYDALFLSDDPDSFSLVDTFRVAHPNRTQEEGTFSGFRANAVGGERIDWIAASDYWQVIDASIDRTAVSDRTPSDHFPVTAILRFPAERANKNHVSVRAGDGTSDVQIEEGPASGALVYCSAAKDQAIDVLQLNPQTGELTKLSRCPLPGEPGALALSADNGLLFAAMRSTGMLASLRVDRETGRLSLISMVNGGADPAQISIDHTGRWLLTAYYVAGKVSVHRIADDGSLSSMPVQEISTAEKAHFIGPDATNKFVFVPHTGPNAIFQFVWNAESGRLSPQTRVRLDRPAMSGPRHMAWHPSKPIAYIDNEQSSSVTAYQLSDDGTLIPGVTLSTLPSGYSQPNSTAEIKVHPSGRFLYVSNRGHDSLAVFEISESGTDLSFVGNEPTEKTPRSFDIDSTGQFLFAAGESSGRLAMSRIHTETGRLTPVHTEPIGPMLWWVQCEGTNRIAKNGTP